MKPDDEETQDPPGRVTMTLQEFIALRRALGLTQAEMGARMGLKA